MFVQGSHAFNCNVPTCGVRYLETCSKLENGLLACIVWLYCVSRVYYVVVSGQFFFLVSVWSP